MPVNPEAEKLYPGELSLSYIDTQLPACLSVCGEGKLEKNSGKAEAIWGQYENIWFPEGPQSPGIAILEVTPSFAEYWKIDDSIAKIFWELSKSRVTRNRPDIGTNVKIEVSE